jgi:hypothetical protein
MNRLDREMARLTEMLSARQPSLTWRTIQFVDSADVWYAAGTMQVPRRALRSPDDYARRFEDHLRAGYSWINLNAAGVVDGVLVVIVEVPDYLSGAPEDKVAVNPSGTSGQRVKIVDDCSAWPETAAGSWGEARGRPLSPLGLDILRACDEMTSKAIDPAALGRRLVELTSAPDVPAHISEDANAWCRQLEAAGQWYQAGDVRGMGRAEGIAFSVRESARGCERRSDSD